jgi:Xaa-Pro aminopeptidase
MNQLGPEDIVIMPAATHAMRNRDSEYAYRQDSDFIYLSGFTEPGALMVLCPGRKQGQYLLFCRERDPLMETWNGYRAGPEGALKDYGVNEAHPCSEIDSLLPKLLVGRKRVYYSRGCHDGFDARVQQWLQKASSLGRDLQVPQELCELAPLLHEQRLLKSPAEQSLMRKAGKIAARGHRRAMAACIPDMYEYQLEAELLHEFMHAGARHPAYTSIVGSGANGCILHYVENNSRMRDGDLVLIDAGCELEHYASDVTRTFPVNGHFSPAQKALYEIVLQAQLAAIAKIAPGRSANAAHETAVRVITRGLVKLGLLKGDPAALVKSGAYRKYFMHGTSHWLGLDVHDVGNYKTEGKWRKLEPGMVLTIEPGVYVPEQARVAKKWRGIGIRIEDDVLVTEEGCEVLTAGVPTSVDEIEALVGSSRRG